MNTKAIKQKEKSWHTTVITLYPEMFPAVLGQSLAGKALEKGIWSLETIDIKEDGIGKHRKVDDAVFGGGAGLLLRPDVVDKSIKRAMQTSQSVRPFVYATPKGIPMTQEHVASWAKSDGLVILCGHFEGIDERVLEKYNPMPISIGDYVLSGGELAAQVMIDACVRLQKGVMNTMESSVLETFHQGLLEHEHYTRPALWEGRQVPDILLSGNHRAIATWRQQNAEQLTKTRRPDLWATVNIQNNKVQRA